MKKILKTFLVEDIYKYCDFFLQTDDSEEEKDPWFACKPNMVYRYFGVMSFDLRERFPEMVVPEECKCKFDSGCNCTKGFGWDAYISDGRKRIRQAKELEERRHNKAIRLEMVESLPFVAYKGKLGISRDFPGIDRSHNSTMAYIISDYLKTVKNAGEIDLEDMYNNYISKWNGDLYEECGFGGFKNNSALSFIVILDTLDVLLGEAVITDHSFLLSGDARMWQVLAESRCWSDVNNCWVKSDPCNAWSSVCRQRKVS